MMQVQNVEDWRRAPASQTPIIAQVNAGRSRVTPSKFERKIVDFVDGLSNNLKMFLAHRWHLWGRSTTLMRSRTRIPFLPCSLPRRPGAGFLLEALPCLLPHLLLRIMVSIPSPTDRKLVCLVLQHVLQHTRHPNEVFFHE
jgi:hypothetical protein